MQPKGRQPGQTGKKTSAVLSSAPKEVIAASDVVVHAPRSHPWTPMMESVVDQAIAVIGNRDEALRWLGTPVRALDYARPISLLGSLEGAKRVNDVLGQMAFGIW